MIHELMITKITNGQQITIPAALRNKLKLKPGTTVEIEIKGKKITISPIEEDLEEMFEKTKKIKPKINISPQEMDKLIEDEIF